MLASWQLPQSCIVRSFPGPSGNWAEAREVPPVNAPHNSASARNCLKYPIMITRLRQCVLAELHALGRFDDGVGPLRNLVLELDARRERVLLLAHQHQDLFNR